MVVNISFSVEYSELHYLRWTNLSVDCVKVATAEPDTAYQTTKMFFDCCYSCYLKTHYFVLYPLLVEVVFGVVRLEKNLFLIDSSVVAQASRRLYPQDFVDRKNTCCCLSRQVDSVGKLGQGFLDQLASRGKVSREMGVHNSRGDVGQVCTVDAERLESVEEFVVENKENCEQEVGKEEGYYSSVKHYHSNLAVLLALARVSTEGEQLLVGQAFRLADRRVTEVRRIFHHRLFAYKRHC